MVRLAVIVNRTVRRLIMPLQARFEMVALRGRQGEDRTSITTGTRNLQPRADAHLLKSSSCHATHLAVASARCAALDAKRRTLGWLPNAREHLLAEVRTESLRG